MSIASKIRVTLASILVSVAGVYACLLAATLMMKGATHQVDVHPIIYVGLAAAATLTGLGCLIAGNVREGIPGVLALGILSGLVQPLVLASSWSHQRGYWALVVVLAAVPLMIVAIGMIIRRRLFPEVDSAMPSNTSLERTRGR